MGSRPTAEEAAHGADVVITCQTADAAVREVFGSSTPVLRPGDVLIDCSTVSPDTARQTARALDERGVYFVDAPVSGGPEAARRGALTLMCGGSQESFAAARSALALFGEQIMYLGPAGSGQVGKAVNQLILAGSLLGVAEGVALARRSGIDVDQLIAGIQRGAAASWVLSNRSDMMLSGDFTPKGRSALHHKDLLIAQQLAKNRWHDTARRRSGHRPRKPGDSRRPRRRRRRRDHHRARLSTPRDWAGAGVIAYRLSGSNLPAICLRNAYAEMIGLWYWR